MRSIVLMLLTTFGVWSVQTKDDGISDLIEHIREEGLVADKKLQEGSARILRRVNRLTEDDDEN